MSWFLDFIHYLYLLPSAVGGVSSVLFQAKEVLELEWLQCYFSCNVLVVFSLVDGDCGGVSGLVPTTADYFSLQEQKVGRLWGSGKISWLIGSTEEFGPLFVFLWCFC